MTYYSEDLNWDYPIPKDEVKKLNQHLDDFFKANSQSNNDELKSKMVETV